MVTPSARLIDACERLAILALLLTAMVVAYRWRA